MIDQKKLAKLLEEYDRHCQRIASATSVNIHESEQEKEKRIKGLEKDYVSWFEYYFPSYAKSKCAWFHRDMAKTIVNNKRLRYLCEMYRSAGKSVHVDMGIPLYLYLAKKDLRFMLLIGEIDDKAKALLSDIQAQLEFNNRIKNDYGQKMSTGDWKDGNFVSSDGVRFMSLGFRQSPRGAREEGERPDYIVVDDVDSKKSVNNDRIMRESLDYITEDVWGCFDTSEKGVERFVFANNNFNKNSITNRLKQYFAEVKSKNLKDGIKFENLKVCAVKDLTSFEPEWKEKTSSQYWRDKFETLPYRSFMREYMHVHIEDGAIFKYENIKYKKALPLEEYDALCFYGDLSYKENADYKAMVLVGKKGKEFHVILVYATQKSRADCAKWLYDVYEQYGLSRYNIRYMIEGLFAMDEFVSDFDAEGDKRGYYIPVTPDKRTKGNKYDKIESISVYFERGDVFFNIDANDHHMQTGVGQLLAFEKGSGAHDDFPDALSEAIGYLNTRTRISNNTYLVGKRTSQRY